jgi:SAM-dependent methyltransferase
MTFTASDFGDYQTEARMSQKRRFMPAFDFTGKRVLDVGCDHGHWSIDAAEKGAAQVVGIDRGRHVRGQGFVDLAARNNAAGVPGCIFHNVEMGRQWPDLGCFDLVYCMSVYHHIFQACGGDHRPIWYWLRTQCADNGVVIWEGPINTDDPVARQHISPALHANFNGVEIDKAASRYFDIESLGPAVHEPTRYAFRMTAKPLRASLVRGTVRSGAGGAAKAFEHAGGRRIAEIRHAFDLDPFPGSLNLTLDRPFDWGVGYFRAQISDWVDRSKGFSGPQALRWCRFAPVLFDNHDAFAMRFEGDGYPADFVELVSDTKLRDDCRECAMLLREI